VLSFVLNGRRAVETVSADFRFQRYGYPLPSSKYNPPIMDLANNWATVFVADIYLAWRMIPTWVVEPTALEMEGG
jgi:hypothetical protein